MNILYLHQYFATPECNGGTRSYEMAKRLVQKGHSVTFVTSSAFLEQAYQLNPGWNLLNIEGITLHVYHLPYSNSDSFFSRIKKFITFAWVSTKKALSIECDLLFATSTPLTIGIPALIYKKLKKKPMVFEVRDLWPELPIAIGAIKNKLLIKALYYFEKTIYKNSNNIIALSPGMKDGIIRTGYPREKISMIPNSCDVELFNIPETEGAKYKNSHLSFIGSRKLVVYAGTFGLINNVNYIVHLAKEAKEQDTDICFVAIGSGKCKEQVVNEAKLHGVLNKNLYILNAIPKTEIKNLYSSADLCLSLFGPIKEMWHNSANKLFDALASQTPIAINYGGWQKDFIERTNCGLVLNNDYKKSVGKLEQFLNNNEQYSSAKLACKHLSHNDFSRDVLFEKFETRLLNAVNDPI